MAHTPDKHWTQSQKLEAVKTYMMLGNTMMTARVLKVPEQTLYRWKRSSWWIEILDELRSQDELVLSARLKKIVEKTFDVVEDRLEHGDFVYDQKSGEMRRKPVNLRDAHKVGLELDNKRDLILNRQAPRASEEQIDDKLNKLAAKFAAIIRGKPQEGEIVDVQSKVVTEGEMVSDEPLFSEILSPNLEGEFGETLQETQS